MTQFTSPQPTAVLDTPSDTSWLATCPLCHTRHASLAQQALEAGDGWRCSRCGQRWDARRLATVAAHAAWVAEYEHRGNAIATWADDGGRPAPPAASRP